MIVTKPLVEGVVLTTSAVAYYTTSSKVTSAITKATVTNTTGTSATVTVYIVPPGGSPAAANTIISAQPIAAGHSIDLFQLHGQKLVTAGESLQALASAGSALSLRVTGYEQPN